MSTIYRESEASVDLLKPLKDGITRGDRATIQKILDGLAALLNGKNHSEVIVTGADRPRKQGLGMLPILTRDQWNPSERFRIRGTGSFSGPGFTVTPGIDLTLEKLVGKNNLMNIAWLARGLQLARCVCRIRTPDGAGTGFLIGSDLVMTNNHVLPDGGTAQSSVAEFNFEKDWNGNPTTPRSIAVTSGGFRTSEALDYTITRLEGAPGNEFGWIDLNDPAIPSVNTNVSIIQHPLGGPKQIAVTDNKVANVFGNHVQYETDTEPGSSGSPVFDEEWRIVAIHHKGGDLEDPSGATHWINQGVLMNAIVQDAFEVTSLTDPLLDLATTYVRPLLHGVVSGQTPAESATPFLAADWRFNDALNRWILIHSGEAEGVSDSHEEIAPLLAAAAGVAVGAAIRHWGRKNESKEIGSLSRNAPKELVRIIAEVKGKSPVGTAFYNHLVARTGDLVRFMPKIIKMSQEVIPVLAACFLAGVAAGAAAYDGR